MMDPDFNFNFAERFLNRKFLIRVLTVIAIIFIVFPLSLRIILPIFNRILGAPDLKILEDYHPIGSIEIYDYEDNFVGVLQGQEDRQVVKLNQISDYAKQAVLAAEDSDFYHHSGFSLTSIMRAMAANLKAGRVVQGGSTISQQMVKNLFIKEDERYKRTIFRKVLELLIAFEVEAKYPKDKILEIYLNQVYFGNLAYGIERAAQRYFSKPSSRLNIQESAFLAGLLTAPSYLAKNTDKAIERQHYVLKKMFENGYINKQEYDKAMKTKLEFRYSKGNLSLYPYYFSYVEQELTKRYNRSDLKSLGLKVYTGLDPVAQGLAEETLDLGIKNAASGINQGAIITLDVTTGEIRAVVGGVGDYWRHQFNRAINPHTIGSAIKPFVYLTAFMQGIIDPSTIIDDTPLSIRDDGSPGGYWVPQNFDDEYHGPITAKAALVFSRNVPAVRVALKAGVKNVIETAREAGIRSPMINVPSFALGAMAFSPLEVANAYSTIARGGTYIEPILIRKITDRKGNVLEVNTPSPKGRLPEIHVAQLVGILEDVVNFGTGALAKLPDRAVAGKTGTADGSRDIWFVGFTTDYVTAVWCGNERNLEVGSRYATGGSTPAWVWKEYMSKYYELRPKPPRPFSYNVDYKLLAIDPLTGLLATEYTPNPVYKRFAPGTEPKESAPVPEVDEIKSREKPREITVGQPSSNEDRRLRTAAEIKEKSENAPKPMPKLDVQPRPKQFKILNTTNDTEETINDRQETQTTPTAKPKIPEGLNSETRANIGG